MAISRHRLLGAGLIVTTGALGMAWCAKIVLNECGAPASTASAEAIEDTLVASSLG